MLLGQQFQFGRFEISGKLRWGNKARVFVALLMGVALLGSTFLVLGAGKVGSTTTKNKESIKCPSNESAPKILPLNRAKVPRPPVPSKFLGLSRATFSVAADEFETEGGQWCWGSHCVHIQLYCSEGTIGGGPCCFNCCNQWGCSENTCCACIGC